MSVRCDDFPGFGEYSPNEKYIVAWHDSIREKTATGYHENNGSFLFVEDGNPKLTGTLQRPNEGHVANNGTFLIVDWLFDIFNSLKNNYFRKKLP